MTFHDLEDTQTHHPSDARGDELEIFEGALLEIVLHETRRREADYSVSRFAVANFLVHTCDFHNGQSPADYLDALEEEVGSDVIVEAAAQFDNVEIMANLIELSPEERHEVARSVIDEVVARQRSEAAFKQAAGRVVTRQQMAPPEPTEPAPALALAA